MKTVFSYLTHIVALRCLGLIADETNQYVPYFLYLPPKKVTCPLILSVTAPYLLLK